jgi:RAQPRD family integrative conjugative element protein
MNKPTSLIRVALLLGLCAAFASTGAQADEDSEREQLARIASELQHLQARVAEASRSAPTAPRVKFRYDWLQRDLTLMRQGIEEHLDAPRQPRVVPPLRGDYRQ